MNLRQLHPWNVDESTAVMIQEWLRARIVTSTPKGEVMRIAGCDVNCDQGSPFIHGAVCTYTWPDLSPTETKVATMEAPQEYDSGLLAFRVVPVILECLAQLPTDPDIIIMAANGMCHPRRFGSASHLGVITNTMTIGVAPPPLCGRVINDEVHMDPINIEWPDVSTIISDLGLDISPTSRVYESLVARKVGELYVSIGNLISLDDAVATIKYIIRKNSTFLTAAHDAANKVEYNVADV